MPRKRNPPTIELGSTGVKQWNGRIDEEAHARLRGNRAAKIYEEMASNDAVIGAATYAIEAFLRRVEWDVEPADDSEAARKEAEWMESVLDDMDQPLEEIISELLSFLVYGFALHEQVLKIRLGPEETNPRFRSKYNDGRIGLRALAPRAQTSIDRWDMDDATGRTHGAWQVDPVTGNEVYLPLDRCLHIRTKSRRNNPEGVSILRNAYRSWSFKKRLEEIEAIGISRDLTGIPVVEMPAAIMSRTASDDQRSTRQAMERLVSQIARDEREGIVFPSEMDSDGKPTGYKLRLLSSPGQKQIPADPVIRRYDSRIAMSVMADFLMLGTEKTGSFAMASQKSSNFMKALEFYMGNIASALNKQVVQRLCLINNIPPELWPEICPGQVAAPDLKELGLFLQQVAGAGLITPSHDTENELREIADLPEKTEEEFAEEEAKAAEEKQAETDAQMALAAAKGPPPAPGQPPAEAPPPEEA